MPKLALAAAFEVASTTTMARSDQAMLRPTNIARNVIALWIAGLTNLSAPLLAQATRPNPKEPAAGSSTSAESRADTYTESTSRDLFSSCDANSDDRLDVFEACAAFDSLRDLDDHAGFARLDKNRDGFVGWAEFDAHFQATLKQGNTLRVRSCRRLVQQAPEHQEARPATPLQQFLQLHDANQNGGLDPTELDKLAQLTIFLPNLGPQLRNLDLDRSGCVEEAELAPWFEQLRGLQAPGLVPGLVPGLGLRADSQLIPPWAAGDQDHSGSIDQAELGLMLQSLDPSLLRWSAALLQKLDANRDGLLSAAELLPAKGPASRSTSPANPAPLPKQTPLR